MTPSHAGPHLGALSVASRAWKRNASKLTSGAFAKSLINTNKTGKQAAYLQTQIVGHALAASLISTLIRKASTAALMAMERATNSQ